LRFPSAQKYLGQEFHGGFLFVGFFGSANPNLSAERDKLSVRMTRARVHDTTLARANTD
jgi:hypothetical protein